MRFEVAGRFRDRSIEIVWQDGQVAGDEEFVKQVVALDGSGEPVATLSNGEIVEAGLGELGVALDTICYLIGDVTSVTGDLPSGTSEADFVN